MLRVFRVCGVWGHLRQFSGVWVQENPSGDTM